MAGISIPGVSDKYKTNDLVESLMKAERIPLDREQKTLDGYKEQQTAWRSVNKNMSSLRETVRSLYSYDNPFNNKLASSTDEAAITAEAGRDAAFESFKIEVLNPAAADRFLSAEIEKNAEVPAGTYTYRSGDKSVSMNWKGGALQDFTAALNKRSNGVVKASLIGVSAGKQSLMIESLHTGNENKLIFEDAALDFAESVDMIRKVKPQAETFAASGKELRAAPETAAVPEQEFMPPLSEKDVSYADGAVHVPPRGSFSVKIPAGIAADPNQQIEFTVFENRTEDITAALNEQARTPELPDAGSVSFKGIQVENIKSDTTLPAAAETVPKEPLVPVEDDAVFSVRMKDGSEKQLAYADAAAQDDGGRKMIIRTADYDGIDSIVVRNRNTGKEFSVSAMSAYNRNADLGFEPSHPVSTAADAKIKYEGITITRPTNTIDDIVPNVTLTVAAATEKPATIKIEPDTESAKEALITFIGKYNQVVAEMNILTQNKPELITELEYLTDAEIEQYDKWLGLFQNDFSLTNGKSAMQTIMSTPYQIDANTDISMLSQIGISGSATAYSGYSASKMRGYMEIDEKKLDAALKSNLADIKNIFGYDSDGDLIIDSGIAYQLDKRLQSFVQSGGILATKTSGLDGKITDSESKIKKLETQLASKEQELKQKYGQMESTLNSLESQSNSITNTFSNQNNR